MFPRCSPPPLLLPPRRSSIPSILRRWPAAPALAAAALLPASCATPFPDDSVVDRSPAAAARARSIVDESVRAHGGDPYVAGARIAVDYEGTWSRIASRLQPVLIDAGFRGTSREEYDLPAGTIRQRHEGPMGTKSVDRTLPLAGGGRQASIEVAYNGTSEDDPEKRAAAALVCDGYLMFLTAPSWALHAPIAEWGLLPDAEEDGSRYHRVFLRLEPGLGMAASDDVVLWIESGTMRAHRLHFTLNGLESTQGAHVDVTFLTFTESGGFLWPSAFRERLLSPLRLDVHEWRATRLDASRRQPPPA